MKNLILQVRVTEEEKREVIERSNASGMCMSDYMRSALLGAPICQTGAAQRAMTHLCRAFSILNQMDTKEAEDIREELNNVCRALK